VFYSGDAKNIETEAWKALCAYAPMSGEPVKTWVEDWREGLPQYMLGHQARLARIKKHLKGFPDMYLDGSSFSGMSISDCVRIGRELAQKIVSSLQDSASAVQSITERAA
jgi:oxygen-dependent protoporphyrinogen oxidase